MSLAPNPDGLIHAQVVQGIIVPAEDFTVACAEMSVFSDLNIHDPIALNARLHSLLLECHSHIQDFFTTPTDTLLINDTPLADALITDSAVKTFEHLTALLAVHEHPATLSLQEITTSLHTTRAILNSYSSSEITVRDFSSIKAELPELLITIRNLSILTQNMIHPLPHDPRVDSFLAETVHKSAGELQGAVPVHIVHGNPSTAWKFIQNFSDSLSSLGSELRILCDPRIAFDAPTVPGLFVGTHQFLASIEGLSVSNNKVGLKDFIELRRVGSLFERARNKFFEALAEK